MALLGLAVILIVLLPVFFLLAIAVSALWTLAMLISARPARDRARVAEVTIDTPRIHHAPANAR